MKNAAIKSGKVMLIVFAMWIASPAMTTHAQSNAGVSFSLFYNSLAPYGYWVDDPAYGYVWVPEVGASFRPYYSSGHWVMTSYGNMWVSDYPWGWAPFHYGRWIYDGYYGWLWVPGTVWGPAWVSWRWGGGYAGWAPLAPGVSLSVAFNSYAPPYDWWVFIEPTYLYSPVFYRYYGGPSVNVTYLPRTSLVSNTYVYNGTTYIAGPRAADIERSTNQRVAVYDVKDGNLPSEAVVSGKTANVYRPEIKSSGKGVAPARYTEAEQPIGKMSSTLANDGKPERLNTQSERVMRESSPSGNRKAETQPSRSREVKVNAPDHARSNREEYDRSRQEKREPVPQKTERPESPRDKKQQAAPNQKMRKQDQREPFQKQNPSVSPKQEKRNAAPGRETQQKPAVQPQRMEQRQPAPSQAKPRGEPAKRPTNMNQAPVYRPQPPAGQHGSQPQPRQPKEQGGKK